MSSSFDPCLSACRRPTLTGVSATARRPRPRVVLVAALAGALLLALGSAGKAQAKDFWRIHVAHSGKVLMVENHSKALGARVVQARRGPGAGYGAQHWFLEEVGEFPGGNLLLIRNRHSKLCLHHAYWDDVPGREIVQDRCGNRTLAKVWAFNQYPFFIRSALSGQYMGVAGASHDDGAPLVQWPTLALNDDHMLFGLGYGGQTG